MSKALLFLCKNMQKIYLTRRLGVAKKKKKNAIIKVDKSA